MNKSTKKVTSQSPKAKSSSKRQTTTKNIKNKKASLNASMKQSTQSSCVHEQSLESFLMGFSARQEINELDFLVLDETLKPMQQMAIDMLVMTELRDAYRGGASKELVQEEYNYAVKKVKRLYFKWKIMNSIKKFFGNKIVYNILWAVALTLLLNAFFVIGTEKEMFEKYYGGIFTTQEQVDNVRNFCSQQTEECVFILPEIVDAE
jgi:hypothetical protein